MHDHSNPKHDHSCCMHHQAKVNNNNKRITFIVMVVTTLFMFVEFIGGYVANSLALIADAGHMLTDSAALFLAYYAFYLSTKPADINKTFGYHRFQVLASLVNGITIILLSIWIFINACIRFFNPIEVQSEEMFIIAIIGLFVNIFALMMLNSANSKNLNIQGAKLHVLGDMLGSVAAIASAIVIYYTQWMQIDAILSIIVAFILVKSAWLITVRSVNILLESTPDQICQNLIVKDILENFEDIDDIHHMHIWSLNSEIILSSMHIVINKDAGLDNDSLINSITSFLNNEYNIQHCTIQVEFEKCDIAKNNIECF